MTGRRTPRNRYNIHSMHQGKMCLWLPLSSEHRRPGKSTEARASFAVLAHQHAHALISMCGDQTTTWQHENLTDVRDCVLLRSILTMTMTMTHSEKSIQQSLEGWPYRDERRGHDPANKSLLQLMWLAVLARFARTHC